MSASLEPMLNLFLGLPAEVRNSAYKSLTHERLHCHMLHLAHVLSHSLCECLLVRTCLQSTFKRRRVFNTLSLFMPLYA